MATGDGGGDSAAGSVPRPSKARDLFAAATDVFPVLFNGGRVHLLLKSRDTWALEHGQPPPPPPVPAAPAVSAAPGWSAASAAKLSADGTGFGLRVAGTLGFRSRLGWLACGTADVNPVFGNWSFESVARSAGGAVDVAVAGQVCAWTRPLTCTYDVDYTGAVGTALSVTVEPVRRTCAFQCLQAVTRRLSLGAELSFTDTRRRTALMARYAGPAYLLCAKADPLAGKAMVAWYQHNSDRLQTGVVLDVNRPRSVATVAMAFRVLSGRSSVRGAVHTNGVVSGQLERRQGDGVSASLTASFNVKTGRYGLGVGLSLG